MKQGEWFDNYEKGEHTPLLNRLLTDDDVDPIELMGEDGKELKFEQCATIPYEGVLYAVLHPITKIEGIGEDECVIFRYEQRDGEEIFRVEEDEDLAQAVYDVYLELLEEANGDDE